MKEMKNRKKGVARWRKIAYTHTSNIHHTQRGETARDKHL